MTPAVAHQHGPAPSADRILGAVLQAAPAAIVTLDGRGFVTLWNALAERVFGWPADDVIGRQVPDLLADDGPDPSCPTRLLLRPPGAERVAICRRRDGTLLDLRLDVAPIRDEVGRDAGAVLVFSEPVDRPSRDRAGPGPYRMEALTRFAAGVGHDVNNVLAAISGYADVIAADLPADSPSQADVLEIQRATERIARLTGQLLSFGRRSARRPEILLVDEVIVELESMLRRLATPTAGLVVIRAAGVAKVEIDRTELEQILINLVVNARDALPGGGTIHVASALVELDDAFVAAHTGAARGPHVRITVRDDGLGMDETTLAHLFEPYYTTKPPGKGFGLGLATVYGAIKQADGYITAESRLGNGTTMTLSLPSR